MAHRVLLVVVLAVVLAVPVVTAQQPSPLREEVTVSIVEVPVFVSKNGVAVKGLTKDDFELRVNGKVHPIEAFDVLEFNRQTEAQIEPDRGASPLERPLTQRRLMVLLFDVSNSSQAAVWRSRAQVEKFISEASPHDVFAVAVYSKARGVRYLSPFTTDRVAVMRAVHTLTPSASGDTLGIATLENERTEWTPGTGWLSDISSYDATYNTPERDLERRATAVSGETEQITGPAVKWEKLYPSQLDVIKAGESMMGELDDRHFISALAQMADNLVPLEGVKQVILFSEGPSPVFKRDIMHYARELHGRFRKAGVVLHAVDLGGMRAPWRDTDGSSSTADELYTLALDTGGTVVANAAVNKALQVLYDMQSTMYVVAFRPPQSKKARNDIQVRVKNKGAFTDVHYRRGYSAVTADDRARSGLFLADVLLNDIPQNDISVDVAVKPGALSTVSMQVPGTELLAYDSDGPLLTLDVFLYVFDENRKVAGWSFNRLRLDVEKGRKVLEGGPYVIQERFRLEPGKYAAKALWRISGEDRRGFDRADFEVQMVAANAK